MSEKEGDEPEDNVVRVSFGAPREQAPEDPTAGEKLEVFARLIHASKVLVKLDARVPGVRVPPQFAGDPQLGLNFSHRFGIADFGYDERGVRASLSFQGEAFFCDVPWSAVFMARSYETGEVALFPGSLPPEIAPLLEGLEPRLTAARPEADRDKGASAEDAVASPRHAISAARHDEDETHRERPRPVAPSSTRDADEEEPEPPDDGPRRPPGLRLVKG